MINILSLFIFLQAYDYSFRELEAFYTDLHDSNYAWLDDRPSMNITYFESPEYVGKFVRFKKLDGKCYLVTEKDFFRVILDTISTNVKGDSCFIQMKVTEQGENVTYESYIGVGNHKYRVDSNFSKLKFLKLHKKAFTF